MKLPSAVLALLALTGLTAVASAPTLTIGQMILSWAYPPFAAKLEDGRCSICKRNGWKSTVTTSQASSCTVLACAPGQYDERGHWIEPKPCNTCWIWGTCSRGHEVVEIWKSY